MGDAAKPLERARFVTVAAAAEMFGFRNQLACKRFCLRHGVPLRCVGKHRFVAPADLEALIAGRRPLPANEPRGLESADDARVAAAVAKITGGSR